MLKANFDKRSLDNINIGVQTFILPDAYMQCIRVKYTDSHIPIKRDMNCSFMMFVA